MSTIQMKEHLLSRFFCRDFEINNIFVNKFSNIDYLCSFVIIAFCKTYGFNVHFLKKNINIFVKIYVCLRYKHDMLLMITRRE